MADFSLNACRRAINFEIEHLHGDPIRMLGEYTLRATQDPFFNKTMITAMMEYIAENNIKWND